VGDGNIGKLVRIALQAFGAWQQAVFQPQLIILQLSTIDLSSSVPATVGWLMYD